MKLGPDRPANLCLAARKWQATAPQEPKGPPKNKSSGSLPFPTARGGRNCNRLSALRQHGGEAELLIRLNGGGGPTGRNHRQSRRWSGPVVTPELLDPFRVNRQLAQLTAPQVHTAGWNAMAAAAAAGAVAHGVRKRSRLWAAKRRQPGWKRTPTPVLLRTFS